MRGGATFSAYTPMTPAAAMTNTAGGVSTSNQTISQMAYGINGTGSPSVGPMPALGAVGAGVLAVGILVFLWWSLPR